jgi:hypothetical protein
MKNSAYYRLRCDERVDPLLSACPSGYNHFIYLSPPSVDSEAP